jgi:hypothetical protein
MERFHGIIIHFGISAITEPSHGIILSLWDFGYHGDFSWNHSSLWDFGYHGAFSWNHFSLLDLI